MVGSRVRPLQRIVLLGILLGMVSLVLGGLTGVAHAGATIGCGATVVTSIVLDE